MKSRRSDALARKLAAATPVRTAKMSKKKATKRRQGDRKSRRVPHNEIVRITLKRVEGNKDCVFSSERRDRKFLRIYNAVVKEFLIMGHEVCFPGIGKLRMDVRKPKARTKLLNQTDAADLQAQLHCNAVRPLKNAAKAQKRMEIKEEEGARKWAKKRQAG